MPHEHEIPVSHRFEGLMNRVSGRLERRAFLFEDPASYRAGVEDSRAALREAMRAFPTFEEFVDPRPEGSSDGDPEVIWESGIMAPYRS